MSDDDYNFYAPGDYPADYPNDEQRQFLSAICSKRENAMQDFIWQRGAKTGYFYKSLSMMELAAKYDSEQGVKALLDAKINPNDIAYEWNMPALGYAVLNDNLSMAKLLLERGADPNMYYDYHKYHDNPTKKYPLGLAIEMDSPLMVHQLLNRGANANTLHVGEPLIVLAAKKAHPCVIDLLAENGANINAQDKDGNTALHIAALTGNTRLVKKLIEKYHANTLIQNNNKDLPMHLAMQNPNFEVLKLLQTHGTPIFQENIGKESVASLAVKSNNQEILHKIFHWLHPYEAVYLKDDNLNALLPIAACLPLPIATHHLAKHVTNFNEPAEDGKTALHKICCRGNMNQFRALMAYSEAINFNQQDLCGNTALHYACDKQYKEIISTLLEKGADYKIKNYFGKDVIEMLEQKGDKETIAFIEQKINKQRPNAVIVIKHKTTNPLDKSQERQNS